MELTIWRLLMMYSFIYLQVTADDQVILSDVTNTSKWFGWSEENSLAGAYWTLCDDDVILLNTTQSGNETVEQYSLLSPFYTMPNNCNVSISYIRQAEITVEVIARSSDDDNITIANLSSTIDEVPLVVNISQSIVQIIFSVTTNLSEELLTIYSVSFSDCSDVVSPTPSVESSLATLTESAELLQTSSISTGIVTVTELLSTTTVNTTTTPDVTSTSLLSVMPTTTMSSLINTIDIVSVTSSVSSLTSATASVTMASSIVSSTSITVTSKLVPTFTTTTVNTTTTPDVTSLLSVMPTTTMSSLINTTDIVSVTSSSLLESTSSLMNNRSTAAGMTSVSTPSAILSTSTLAPVSTTSNIVISSSKYITSSSITSLLISVSPLTSTTASVTMVTVQSSSSIQSLNTSLMTETSLSSLSSSTGDIISALSTEYVVVIQSTSVQSVNSTSSMMTETPSVIVRTTDMSLLSTTVMPSSSNASESSSDTNFFSTNVIIGIAAGGGTLILILLCFLVCCLYRICFSQRSQHQKYFISDTGYKNSHKGHSSVYVQERYRHKSRSVESMNGPCQYELPFIPTETPPEAYVHNTNGDEDTIDSESEDIRRDLKGTPTSSHPESQSAASDHVMTNFYPRTADHHHWSDYSSDNNDDETSSDIVYPNNNLVNDMCSGELPPILSLGDYEDDENVVIVNPYNYPTFYSESSHMIPNKDASPRRSGTTKSINLEALTTLESSGEYTPKPTVPNYRRKQSRYAAGKNHKLLRKTKSELNLEDATKIAGGTRYPKHQSKSRIDLKEATKLASHSGVARVNHHHTKPHHSSTPRILDSSSKLERLTSLDTY